jgi:hypothetical protein
MKSFSQFTEEKKKTLVTAFGRFNPPTIGHQKLIDKVAKVAGKNDYQIYPSQSQDAKKNPLSYNDKVKFMRKMFPKHARNIYMDKNVKMALHIADRAYKEGYTEFVYVAGSDRVNEFKVLLNKYNGKERKDGFYNFKDGIQVISAGERDPDAEGVSGMSASKMRAAAADNDLELFATGLPKNFGEVQELLNAIRKGMGLKESFIFRKHIALPKVSDIREQYTEGNIFNIGDRVTKAGVELRVVERKPNFVVCENAEKVTFKCWLEDLQPIEEKLDPKADVETWIDDFVKSDAPQFKGKDKKKRIDMALAAYYSARREAGLEEEKEDDLQPIEEKLDPKAGGTITVKLSNAQISELDATASTWGHEVLGLEDGWFSLERGKLVLSKEQARSLIKKLEDDYGSRYGLEVSGTKRRMMMRLKDKLANLAVNESAPNPKQEQMARELIKLWQRENTVDADDIALALNTTLAGLRGLAKAYPRHFEYLSSGKRDKATNKANPSFGVRPKIVPTPDLTRYLERRTRNPREAGLEEEKEEDDLQGPDRYYAKDAEGDEMAKSTKKSRSSHFKKQTKKATDDPSAYKPAPGDASAKTKPSKYTKKYQQLYGKKK